MTLKRIVVVGILLRVVLLIVTSGSNDIVTWERFGREIAALGRARRVSEDVRSTTRRSWGSGAERRSGSRTTPSSRSVSPSSCCRSPPTCSGCGSFTRSRGSADGALHAWRAAAVFSTSLMSIVITGHHGNTDSVCAVLALVAVALMADGRRPVRRGPGLRRRAEREAHPARPVARGRLLLPDVRTMVRFGDGLGPRPHSVRAAGDLRVGGLLQQRRRLPTPLPAGGASHCCCLRGSLCPGVGSWFRSIDCRIRARAARYVIMAASLGLGVWARRSKRSAVEVAALVFAMFLFLAPAIGVQYLVIAGARAGDDGPPTGWNLGSWPASLSARCTCTFAPSGSRSAPYTAVGSPRRSSRWGSWPGSCCSSSCGRGWGGERRRRWRWNKLTRSKVWPSQ